MEELEIYNQAKIKPDIRELTLANGIEYPSDEELLMLILGKGTQDMPVEKLARHCLRILNGTPLDQTVERLRSVKGMGEAKALTLSAALELGRRRYGFMRASIKSPFDVIPYLKQITLDPTERFICISLNGAHEILQIRTISIGTTNCTLVHPREVLAEPVAEHASGIICCHNHPCGPCLPSSADLQTTKVLIQSCMLLGISFLDHIILTRSENFSFSSHGLLEEGAIEEKMEKRKNSSGLEVMD